MSSFFTLSLEPKITRDYVSLEHSDVQLLADGIIEVSAASDLTADTNIFCVISNFRGADIIATDFASVNADFDVIRNAEAVLVSETDIGNGLTIGGGITADKQTIVQAIWYSTTNLYFNGGRLYDFVVNARYAKPGYALEGYVADIPAAPVIATVDVDGDITSIIITAFNTTMTTDADAVFSPTIQITDAFSPVVNANATFVDSIAMSATTAVSCEALRIQPGDITCVVSSNTEVEAVKITDIVDDIASEASVNLTITKILGNILIDNMSSPFALECEGDDLILDEGFIGVQVVSSLEILAGFKADSGAAMVATSTMVVVTPRVLHTEEYVYVIPPESRYYKINGETRIKPITQESGVFKIVSETRIKAVDAETRIHTLRR